MASFDGLRFRHWQVEARADGVLVLAFDRAEAAVNTFSQDVMLELGGYDWIVFTSTNGVRFFFDEFNRLFEDIRALGLLRFACIGDATAQAIRALHLKVECQPEKATAEALAAALIATGSLDSAKVLVITGNLNRDTLVLKLEEARAIVDCLQVYKTEKTDLSGDAAAKDFRERGADAILFASSSSVQSRSVLPSSS